MKRTLALCAVCLFLLLPVLADEEVTLFTPPAVTTAPLGAPGDGSGAPAVTETPAATEASAPAENSANTESPAAGTSAAPELSTPLAETTTPAPEPSAAREAFIDDMLALAEKLYKQAGGRAQPANSAGDIWVCKNFTVHLFRQNRDKYALRAYPDVQLRIPNNLPAKESKPYSYGIAWEEVAAEQGNPFVAAHSFYYDSDLSREENREKALAFMREVRRGDFFQMSANYYYGVGAHSAVFTADYDPATDTVRWTDSNMKGESRGGKRYGYVQYDAEKPIEWFVDAFCQKGRGATLYRLSEDLISK